MANVFFCIFPPPSPSFLVSTSRPNSARQHELQRITQENQAILKRIQSAQPQLDSQALETDFLLSRKHLAAISKYPTPQGLGSGVRDDTSTTLDVDEDTLTTEDIHAAPHEEDAAMTSEYM